MDYLFSNQKQIFNSPYFKIVVYFISAFIFAHYAGLSLPDDGLRHIAFAANQDIMKSWGDVFPHSLFFKEYDPWFTWHEIIKLYLYVFSFENVHIAINTTVLFTSMFLLDRLILRYSNFKSSSLIMFIILSVVLLSSFRYINIRPDLLSGFFLMSALLLNRHIFILFLFTILYSTSYYLFFLYTGTMGLLYLVLKNYKALIALFIGSLIGLAFHLYIGGEYYIDTIIYLLTDQSLREGLEIGEGVAFFEILRAMNYYVLVFLAWGVSFFLIYKKYVYFQKQPIALLLLLMSPLWLAQARYVSLLKPLFFLYFFIELRTILSILLSRKIQYFLYRFFHILKTAQYKPIFLVPALAYTSFMYGYLMKEYDNTATLKAKYYYENNIFDDQTVLLNTFTIDIYYALYLNPTIKFIPSCGIGWFEKNYEMKDIYIRMMKDKGINEEELNRLLEYLGAKYYIHSLSNAQQILSFKELKKFNIEAKLILDNKIIFEKKSVDE